MHIVHERAIGAQPIFALYLRLATHAYGPFWHSHNTMYIRLSWPCYGISQLKDHPSACICTYVCFAWTAWTSFPSSKTQFDTVKAAASYGSQIFAYGPLKWDLLKSNEIQRNAKEHVSIRNMLNDPIYACTHPFACTSAWCHPSNVH